MTKPEHLHASTDKLALLAKLGDLVVAIDATQVFQIHHAGDLRARQLEANLYAIELDKQTLPGWDLGELFAYGPSHTAWVIVDVARGSATQRFGLRVGACVTVRKLPPTYALPATLSTSRPGAFAGAFSAATIAELADSPSGVVLDLEKLLGPLELDAAARVTRTHRGVE